MGSTSLKETSMKLGLIFAACMLVAGCGAAASVDSSAVPNSSSDGGTSTGSGDDSATGASGDDGSSSTDPDGGSTTADSGSSSGGDDGGSTTNTDSGSSSSGGDDGGTSTGSDSGSNSGDDGGVTVADSGNGGSPDSGTGGGDDGGSTSSDGGTTTADSGSSDSGSSTDSGGGDKDGGHCCAPKCVLTQGYYKNHSSSWNVLPVTMGTNDYSESQCMTLLNDPSVGDASLILAKQYIAAVENGGLCDPNASATMAQAQAWFTDNQNGSLPYGTSLPVSGCASDHVSVPCQAYWLGQSLDSYNNGLSGTPACQ